MTSESTIKIALLQGKAEATPSEAIASTQDKIREAAANGAKIICTQELFTGPYFCTTQNTEAFDLAETLPGPTIEALAPLAKELEVVLILSLFEKRAPGLYHNSAAVIDADGALLGIYRKMHIPQDPAFEEKFYFTPGDTGFKAWDTRYGKIGVIICWDQWYPESARLTALQGAEIIFCPTAIGWLAEEKDELGEAQRHSWKTVQQGHAVANGCYYAAVNRTGHEAPIEFWGTSFVSDYYGQIVSEASTEACEILYADCDRKALEEHRRIWPFFRDRRVDSYDPILKRFDDV